MGGGFGPFTGAGAVSIFTGLPFNVPSTPQGSTMIGAGYSRLPGGDYIPRKIIDNFDRCDPSAFDAAVLQNLSYREKVLLVPAGATGAAIDFEQVPDGFFWYVLAASIQQFGTANQSLIANLLLMPPSKVGAAAPSNQLVAPDGIVVDSQNAVSGGTVQAGPNEVSIARKITVPPGWFLRAALGSGAAVTNNAVQISFRVALAQLKLSYANLKS